MTFPDYPDNFCNQLSLNLGARPVTEKRQQTHQVVSLRLKVITKSFSFANSAITLAKQLLISRHTCEPIQEKKPFSCTLCKYSCAKASNLKGHKRTHSGEKPFHCTLCNYSCKTASALKTPMRTHSVGKPFNCTQCNFSCKSASLLKTHMLTHSGEKPFRCTQCKYSCTQTGALKRHMRTHSVGEKSLSCTHCNYSCANSSTLKIHKRTHTGKNLTIAHNVISPVHGLVILRQTCSHIPEKSLSTVIIATTLAPMPVLSRHTCGPIQEKNLLVAHNVNALTPMLLIWKDIYGSIQEKNRSTVTYATFPLHELVV